MERPHFDIVASGARMRQIRRQRNISVKQVMEYMGFESMQAVYKWEAGKCFPQADNLIALAMLYQVNPIELLVKEEDEMSSSCFLYRKRFSKRAALLLQNVPIFLCSLYHFYSSMRETRLTAQTVAHFQKWYALHHEK